MINFIPCNYDQSIVLGEDPRLYPYIVSDKSNLILNYYGYYNIGKPIFGLEPPVEIFNAPETELIQKYSTMLFYDPNCLKVLIDIALAEYYGSDVYIITDINHPVIEQLVSCVSDWFRYRYGFICGFVYTVEDLLDIEEGEIMPDKFDVFLQDKEWLVRETANVKELLRGGN